MSIAGILGGSLALVWPFLADADARRAALIGGGLAAMNTVLAYALVVLSIRRSTNVFLMAILGGMVGRMAAMLVAVGLAVGALDLPRTPLVVSLLGYFVVFLVLELSIIQKRTRERSEAR